MSRIKTRFRQLFKKKEKALIAYIMVGYPNQYSTLPIVRGLARGGADIIELGFPFSDPLADGPIIQNASTISLNKGITRNKFLDIVKKIRKETEVPLVLMTYTNILYKHGFSRFISEAKKAGIDGIILPDMAIEGSKAYIAAARKNKVDTIFLVSPNTSNKRLREISNLTTGFLYLVSVYGTTGIRNKIQRYTIDAIKNTKKIVGKKIPVGLGFGVSTPKDVKSYVAAGTDAIIVGSAFLRLIEETPEKIMEKKVSSFARKLKLATKA